MAVYGRHGVLDGQEITLRAVLTDVLGNFVDADSIPQVYIYPEDIDSDLMDLEIEAETYTSAIAGPLVPVRIDTGFYELTYQVPLDAETGLWRDVWIGRLSGNSFSKALSFSVINGGHVLVQQLKINELVVIELSESISSYTGMTLANDIQLSFLTVLKPYYASPDLIRMEIGPWIDFIPDSTLALMIHWSSKEADFITGKKCRIERLKFARAKFVVFDAVLRAFYLPGSSAFQPGGATGGSKTLGDLSIKAGSGALVAQTSSGIDVNTLGNIRKQREEWLRIVNAGGCLMPGESLPMQGAIRGKFDPDRRRAGRLWLDPEFNHYSQPGTNSKKKQYGNRYRFHWEPTRSSGTYGSSTNALEYD